MFFQHTTASRLRLLALLLAPVVAKPFSTLNSTNGITWGDCQFGWKFDANIQCGNLALPVNWDEPMGEAFNLGMIRRLRSSNTTTKRIGNLFINPGGPGSSTVNTIGLLSAEQLSDGFLDSFDFVGVDPRGVGLSSPLICNPEIYNERVSLFPKTKAEYNSMVSKSRRLGESCLNQTGNIVNHLDTISAAKDLEAVRIALGGEKLNWLGLSYGTQIGAQYAQLFPDNIRTMVLDGMVQHSLSEASNILVETTAYAAELEVFFEWASIDDHSVLKGQNVKRLWHDLIKNATETPLPAPNPDCISCYRDVTADEIRLNAQNLVTSPFWQGRSYFASALKEASEGFASKLATATLSLESSPIGSFRAFSLFAGLAVGCQDWSSHTSSFEEFQAKMRMAEVYAPLTKGASQTWTLQAACIGWPAPLNNPPAKLKVRTKDPILIVGATRDPSTSYVWALGMLEEIENHVLLTRNGADTSAGV